VYKLGGVGRKVSQVQQTRINVGIFHTVGNGEKFDVMAEGTPCVGWDDEYACFYGRKRFWNGKMRLKLKLRSVSLSLRPKTKSEDQIASNKLLNLYISAGQ